MNNLMSAIEFTLNNVHFMADYIKNSIYIYDESSDIYYSSKYLNSDEDIKTRCSKNKYLRKVIEELNITEEMMYMLMRYMNKLLYCKSVMTTDEYINITLKDKSNDAYTVESTNDGKDTIIVLDRVLYHLENVKFKNIGYNTNCVVSILDRPSFKLTIKDLTITFMNDRVRFKNHIKEFDMCIKYGLLIDIKEMIRRYERGCTNERELTKVEYDYDTMEPIFTFKIKDNDFYVNNHKYSIKLAKTILYMIMDLYKYHGRTVLMCSNNGRLEIVANTRRYKIYHDSINGVVRVKHIDVFNNKEISDSAISGNLSTVCGRYDIIHIYENNK